MRRRVVRIPTLAARGARHLWQMSWALRWEYILVLALTLAGELAVRFLPLDRTARLFRVTVDASQRPATAPVEVLPPWAMQRVRVVRAVMRRWPVDGVCLRDSLVTAHRLRALHPQLKIGVARGERGVDAHAWLEIDGRSLDPSSERYAELLRL